MELVVPSPDCFPSPRLHFASISAKSASALEEAFGQDFDVSDHLGVQLVKVHALLMNCIWLKLNLCLLLYAFYMVLTHVAGHAVIA